MAEPVNTIAPEGTPQVSNYEARVKELEKQLGEKDKQLGEATQFMNDASQLINLVANNPELKEKVRETYYKINGGGQPSAEPSQQQEKSEKKKDANDVPDARLKEVNDGVKKVERSQRSQIIRSFEEKRGIAELSTEKQKEIRRSIEEYLNTFGQSVESVPLETLDVVLDKAHKAVDVERAISEGKLEGYAGAYTNNMGSMPNVNGRNLDAPDSKSLTAEQRSWAEKLGVDPKRAEEVYKNRDKETQRVVKTEEKN